jgi:hypothetical protein
MPPLRVVVVVGHVPLRRVVEELLERRPGLRIVGRFSETRELARELGRLLPDIVVVSLRTLGRERTSVPNAIRQASPDSRLILIHPVPVFPCEARGNRVHLPEEGLVRLLGAAVERLSGGGEEEPIHDAADWGDRPCLESVSASSPSPPAGSRCPSSAPMPT